MLAAMTSEETPTCLNHAKELLRKPKETTEFRAFL